MQKITLFAALGAHNLGDEYIALAEYSFLRDRYPEAKIVIHTYDKNSTLLPKNDPLLSYQAYFPNGLKKHPFRNLWNAFKTILGIATSTMIIIGGGGIFYDNEAGQSLGKQLRSWKFRTQIAKFFRKPIIFFGIGIDVSSENTSLLLPLFSGKNTRISVRDPKSLLTLKQIGVKNAQEIPDPALMGPSIRGARHFSNTSGFTRSNKPTIALALRKWYLKNEFENIEKILEYIESKGYEPIFLNHSFHPEDKETDDSEFVQKIAQKYRIHSTDSIEESYALYEGIELMIAMRLHAGVIAAKNAIPFFLLSYSKKTDEFARRLQHEYILSAKTFDIEIFKSRFEALLAHKQAESFALAEKCDILKTETFNSYHSFFHGLE